MFLFKHAFREEKTLFQFNKISLEDGPKVLQFRGRGEAILVMNYE